MPWEGKNLNYIIISEKTKAAIEAKPFIYHISFNVKNEDEPAIKNIMKGILSNANEENNPNLTEASYLPINPNTFYMITNSDLLAKEQSYIFATRIVMGFFSGILIFFAIISYGNTIITEMIARRKEFAIMQSLGITKKQLRNMLVLEGCFYCATTLGLLLSLGSVLLLAIGKIMNIMVPYFVFQYPLLPFLLFALILLGVSILFPMILIPFLKITRISSRN